MTAQPLEFPHWEWCEEEGCIGVQLTDDGRCLAHTTEEQRKKTLERLRGGGDLDARGVPISQDLLKEILASIPSPLQARFTRATFADHASFAGVTFGHATFTEAVFGDWANFHGATFGDAAFFGGATFGHGAHFSGATFGNDASFLAGTFGSGASFSAATFGDRGNFAGARFGSDASFSAARFGDRADFSAARFGDRADFSAARFGDEAGFPETTFGDGTGFGGATFGDRTRLGPLLVVGSLYLDGVTLGSTTVEVSAARMSCTDLHLLAGGTIFRVRWAAIDFTGADFREPTIVLSRREAIAGEQALSEELDLPEKREHVASGTGPFNASRPRVVSLSRANVANLVLNDVDLAACRFAGAHNLDKLRLEGDTTFAKPPTWRESGRRWWRWTARDTLAEEHEWRAQEAAPWPRPARSYAKRAGWYPEECRCSWLADPEPIGTRRIASLYRALRKAREDAKNEPGAADFYYGEMEMRRKSASTPWLERRVLGLYWLVSGYALRAGRALLMLLILLLFSSALIACFGFPSPQLSGAVALTVTTDLSGQTVVSARLKAPDTEGTSFKTRFANAWWIAVEAAIFRGSQIELASCGEHVRTAARFFGPVMLGLTLLSIRSRVKR